MVLLNTKIRFITFSFRLPGSLLSRKGLLAQNKKVGQTKDWVLYRLSTAIPFVVRAWDWRSIPG
ncbi:hypothetical protein CCP3SC1_310019 [Gammaproteobacteria bacterium]